MLAVKWWVVFLMGHVMGQLMSRSRIHCDQSFLKWIVNIGVNIDNVQKFHGPLNGSKNFSKDLWGWTQTLCFLTNDRHQEEEAFCLKAKVHKHPQEKEYLWYLIPTLWIKDIEWSNTILVVIKLETAYIRLYFRVMHYFFNNCSVYT